MLCQHLLAFCLAKDYRPGCRMQRRREGAGSQRHDVFRSGQPTYARLGSILDVLDHAAGLALQGGSAVVHCQGVPTAQSAACTISLVMKLATNTLPFTFTAAGRLIEAGLCTQVSDPDVRLQVAAQRQGQPTQPNCQHEAAAQPRHWHSQKTETTANSAAQARVCCTAWTSNAALSGFAVGNRCKTAARPLMTMLHSLVVLQGRPSPAVDLLLALKGHACRALPL